MARRSRRRSEKVSRDAISVSTGIDDFIVPVRNVQRSELQEIEDRREFYPSLLHGFKPARNVGGLFYSLVFPRKPATTARRGRSRLAFFSYRPMMICLRRDERKRVLHAMGVAGGRVRKGKRNYYSGISCRRK